MDIRNDRGHPLVNECIYNISMNKFFLIGDKLLIFLLFDLIEIKKKKKLMFKLFCVYCS
jgi:hypothetical protein